MNTGSEMLLNTTVYAMTPLLLLLAGYAAWAVAFVMVFRNMRAHGVVEIPAAAVASNLAWITAWGLFYRTDLGALFVWANRGALLATVIVFGYTLLYGARHVRIPEVRRWFAPGLVASYLCWLILLYLFAYQPYESYQPNQSVFSYQPYETPNGIISMFVVALFMSTLYVLVELSDVHASQYSLTVGWAKLLGNSCGALFCLLVYPANHLLLSLCVITVLLDAMYLLLFRHRHSVSAQDPEPA